MATYKKLRNGAWGLLVDGDAQPGDVVTVTTKAGKVQTRTVGRVLWRGDGKSICTVGAGESRAAKLETYKQRTGICEDAPCCGCCGPASDNENHWY